MKKTITREVDVEVCDTCGDELFEYDWRGKRPSYVHGISWGEVDDAYCSRRCLDKAYPEIV